MASEVLELDRVAIASRAFTLAAIAGLAIAFGASSAAGATLVVVGLAAVAVYITIVSAVPFHWIVAAEASVVSALVVSTLPDSAVLLPYLVVLPLLSGMARGPVGASIVISCQLTSTLVLLATYEGVSGIGERAELLAPWALTITGAGLLGAWAKKLGKSPGGTVMDERYESARRLLLQLRSLARHLSSGLDPVAVAGDLLALVQRRTSSPHAVVLVRTDGGVFSPLAYAGSDARAVLDPNSRLVHECWKHARPTMGLGDPASNLGAAFPLRLGNELVGVLLCDAAPDSSEKLRSVQRELDELSLRLASALAFEEVRTLVTADERQRLAREIHDGIAQEVASLGYSLDDLAAEAGEHQVRDGIQQVRKELGRVVTELRLSIFDLRSEVGDGPGLGSALSDYVRKVGSRSSMTVHLSLDEAPSRLSPGVETELFRIVQEAVTNARKHSCAKNLWVDCWVRPPSARIRVRDDGQGLGAGRRHDSFGLKIMRERAERIGADVDVHRDRDDPERPGTCVTISLAPDEASEQMGAAS